MLSLAAALAPAFGAAGNDPPPQEPEVIPAEQSRLSTAAFRAGLKKRGLIDLLELHVAEFPPASPTDALIMMREIKLAESADPTLPHPARRAALGEANRLLEQMIAENPTDPRRFEWRFTLARSLVYDQAERFYSNVLYRGGSADDRARLLALTDRALKATRELLADLADEYDRVEAMSVNAFERLERSGYIEGLDRLGPRAEYLLLWVLFYNSLARDADDPARINQLNEAIQRVEANHRLTETPHATSHIQVQALLLSGSCHRLLGNHQSAGACFDRGLAVAEGLGDPDERKRIDWAVTLLWLERIRSVTDAARFDEALSLIAKFRQFISSDHQDNFGLRLVAALLERSVYRAEADLAAGTDQSSERDRFDTASLRPLVLLTQQEPARRDEVYAILYEDLGPDADAGRLDPFEQCALISGLLFDADQSPDAASQLWRRVIEIAERFLANVKPGAGFLVPEVKYNKAVAYYRLGRLAAAAEGFLDVAKAHPDFSNAEQAAGFAVQLGSELFNDEAFRAYPQAQRLYRESLEVLTTQYRNTDAARYWQFFYAQLLEDQNDFDAAAEQYARVDPAHEHYIESVFHRVRALALALHQAALEPSADGIELQRRDHRFYDAYREFVALVTAEIGRDRPEGDHASLHALLARARVVAAEVQVLPHNSQPARALTTLKDFEELNPSSTELAGRVWRVRLLAYEKLGRLDEATRAIPEYVAANPDDAGATLQALYADLAADVEKLRARGDVERARRKADLALLVAQQIDALVQRSPPNQSPIDRDNQTLQLAQANLSAGHPDEALVLFESLLEGTGSDGLHRNGVVRQAVVGRAEAHFQLGEYAKALIEFNRLATSLPAEHPVRWRSLLRDLECRTALHEPPAGIIKVIHQQRQLYPDLGGPALTPQFEKLLRENERRADLGG
ncbi:MAG: tetratricopeptide repeat protein [Phycisphaerae bacterium]